MKKLILPLLVLMWMVSVRQTEAILGQVKGYLTTEANVKVNQQFTAKLMMDAGSYRVSVVYVNLGIDTTKIRVNSVKVNSAVFGNVFLEKESAGIISVYAASSKPSAQLPTGVVEVASLDLTAITAGSIPITTKTYEITGPSTSSDFSYGWSFTPVNITVTSGTVSPTKVPTGIPTDRPTNIPTQIPTEMPTPTPIKGNGEDGVLKFTMSFAGVNDQAQCANNWPVAVTVKSATTSKTYNNVQVVPSGTAGNLRSYYGEVLLSGMSETSGLAVFIKGPRHLQVKYGRNGQTDFYNQPGGEVEVSTDAGNSPVNDFSNYPLLAGDVTGMDGVQDGVVDGLDFSYAKGEVNQRSEGDNMPADLNGNCKLESQDLTLLMLAMKDRQEQLY